jgi:hypothetical protein
MFTIRKLLLAGVVLVGLPLAAHAGGFIGVNIGIPIGGCYRPYYYHPYAYPGYYYYRPYPAVYVAPPPVVVQPVPLVEAVPAQPVYPAPATAAAPTLAPVPATTIRATSGETRQGEIDNCLAHLANPDEKVRADMAIQLGRLRALRAVDSLDNTLLRDPSPTVRDSTARALGLIGSNASLTALDQAAQSDGDRDVRRSAQYAAEVIRSNRGR